MSVMPPVPPALPFVEQLLSPPVPPMPPPSPPPDLYMFTTGRIAFTSAVMVSMLGAICYYTVWRRIQRRRHERRQQQRSAAWRRQIEQQKAAIEAAVRALPVVTYTAADCEGGEDEEDECAICLAIFKEGHKLRSLRCGHRFHRECIDEWCLGGHQADGGELSTCPLCKAVVLDLSSLGPNPGDAATPADEAQVEPAPAEARVAPDPSAPSPTTQPVARVLA